MTFIPVNITPQTALWFASLVAVVVLISILALVAERLLRSRSLPVRHGVLLSALLLTASAPLLLFAAGAFGWGIAVPLAWEEALVVETVEPIHDDVPPIEPLVVIASNENAVPAATAAPGEPIAPLTVGDLLGPGEVLEFHAQPVEPRPLVSHKEVDDAALAAPIVPTEPANPTHRVDWRPRVAAIGGWCIVIWSLGAMAAALRLLSGWLQVRRLKSTLRPIADSTLQAKLARAANSVGLRKTPGFMCSSAVPVPAVCGLWRPVIILPRQFTEEALSPSLDAILLHECAHIRRRDLWVGWLQRIVGAIFWWNIPLWGVQRRLNDLREDLCDNHVLAQHPDGRSYARVLLDLVSRASEPGRFPSASDLWKDHHPGCRPASLDY